MPDLELCYLSATEALRRFRARTLSPVELMQAILDRGWQVQPRINCFTFTHEERALAQARAAEARYMKTDGRPRRLEGLPLAVKDLHPIKGEITTHGSRVYARDRSTYTAPTVERLLRAGAIVHARTTTPEFGSAAVTHSPLWGVTRNPWNPDYSPGGSSGGAGAALAAGATTLADGGDYGGSIRIPASCCGIVGYKPPFGRNPQGAGWNFDSYSHVGPLARTVADAILMQNAMAGPHPHDIGTLRPKLTIPPPERLRPIKGWKVGYSLTLGYFEVDPEVIANTHAALDVFRSLGCAVAEVELGWTTATFAGFLAHSAAGFASVREGFLLRHRFEFSDYYRQRTDIGREVGLRDMGHVRQIQYDMYRELGPLLERFDVFVCPTTAVASVPADHDPTNPDFFINGRRVNPRMWVMTNPFNMLGQLPVVAVPSGFAATGVPTGIQIVARSYDDVRALRAAAAYERARPWMHEPAARPKP
jgi:amidase